jgi:hypothetical protein
LKNKDEKPYHANPFPVSHSQEQKLKDEVQRLVEFGVLRKVNRSEWANSTELLQVMIHSSYHTHIYKGQLKVQKLKE